MTVVYRWPSDAKADRDGLRDRRHFTRLLNLERATCMRIHNSFNLNRSCYPLNQKTFLLMLNKCIISHTGNSVGRRHSIYWIGACGSRSWVSDRALPLRYRRSLDRVISRQWPARIQLDRKKSAVFDLFSAAKEGWLKRQPATLRKNLTLTKNKIILPHFNPNPVTSNLESRRTN